jgi:hypothetical protein
MMARVQPSGGPCSGSRMPQSIYLARIQDAVVPAILVVSTHESGDAIVYRSALLVPTKPPVLREAVRSSRTSGDRDGIGAFDEGAIHELAFLQATVDATDASVLIDASGFKPTDWSTLQWWVIASGIGREAFKNAADHVCGIDNSELMQWIIAASRIGGRSQG